MFVDWYTLSEDESHFVRANKSIDYICSIEHLSKIGFTKPICISKQAQK